MILINSILRAEHSTLKSIYLSNMEEFLLERYVIENNRIAREPNPNGEFKGRHKIAYEKLVRSLKRLDTSENCVLIRFYFPGEYRGHKIGVFPWLEPHVTFLKNFLSNYANRKLQSVFQTYGF